MGNIFQDEGSLNFLQGEEAHNRGLFCFWLRWDRGIGLVFQYR